MSDTIGDPVLRLDGVEIRRGRGRSAITVLSDLTLCIGAGEIVGIDGPSGSGKSSLIRVLSGDLQPAAGAVEMRVGDQTGTPPLMRRAVPGSLALIAQSPLATLDSLWPIVRSVMEPLRAAGIGRDEAHDRALEALKGVGLGHLPPDRLPHELSIGQAQRVCIARALSTRPTMLLADEATSALDPRNAAVVESLLKRAASHGCAVVIVSHNVRLLDAMSDRRFHLVRRRIQVRNGQAG